MTSTYQNNYLRILFLTLLITGIGMGCQKENSQPIMPNIIVILGDDLVKGA